MCVCVCWCVVCDLMRHPQRSLPGAVPAFTELIICVFKRFSNLINDQMVIKHLNSNTQFSRFLDHFLRREHVTFLRLAQANSTHAQLDVDCLSVRVLNNHGSQGSTVYGCDKSRCGASAILSRGCEQRSGGWKQKTIR